MSANQQWVTFQGYAVKVDTTSTTNVTYVGKASPGSATNVQKWQIRKLIKDSSGNVTDVEWADGNDAFDNIWDNRVGLAYT